MHFETERVKPINDKERKWKENKEAKKQELIWYGLNI